MFCFSNIKTLHIINLHLLQNNTHTRSFLCTSDELLDLPSDAALLGLTPLEGISPPPPLPSSFSGLSPLFQPDSFPFPLLLSYSTAGT